MSIFYLSKFKILTITNTNTPSRRQSEDKKQLINTNINIYLNIFRSTNNSVQYLYNKAHFAYQNMNINNNIQYQREKGKMDTPMYCLWQYKLREPFWKAIQQCVSRALIMHTLL